ncbi:MAG: TM2 domain-containing protein [Acetobacteraceae bacterium]|nr:TM2 domain-containing protein [Acetobacteraceae bacterium]
MSLAGKAPPRRRSVGLAYALCLVGGVFGLHRFYLGKDGPAACMAAITLLSLPLVGSGLGLLGFVVSGTWALSDLVLIPTMAREANEAVAFA